MLLFLSINIYKPLLSYLYNWVNGFDKRVTIYYKSRQQRRGKKVDNGKGIKKGSKVDVRLSVVVLPKCPGVSLMLILRTNS